MREYSVQWSTYRNDKVAAVDEYFSKFSQVLVEDAKTLISLNLEQQDTGLFNICLFTFLIVIQVCYVTINYY